MENSIEEDIKILESIIKINNDYLKGIENQTINQKEIKALEHILSDYKRVLKENEELRQERELVGLPVKNKRDGKIGIILHQWESGSIAVLENIKPRVINTHDNWNTLEIINDNVEQKRTENNFISIQKVKDKIEEIKAKMGKDCIALHEFQREAKIDVLQELLEKE
nr:MAG TPA: hypothetical protein [Caudoviricetes sp.]